MLSVRAGNTYAMPFVVNLGQRNARIVNGHLTPLRRIIPQTVAFTFIGRRYDLIHSMNAVPLFARAPFIITFEDWMPRTPPDMRIGVLERMLTRVIAKERCVALIAMSQFAKKQMLLQQRASPHYQTLLKKIEVIYPAIAIGDHAPKRLGSALRLLFVGSDFMRKGLPALITAHTMLEKQIPLHTTVVSSLNWYPGDYIGPNTKQLAEATRERLRDSSITVLDRQPNEAVRRLMREHDFLVLPTFDDSFGFVALEAMAMGTPVIATETCALPEIVDQDNGILLPFPTVAGRWRWLYKKQHDQYDDAYLAEIDHLSRALVDCVLAVWGDSTRYERMSAASLATIARRFDQQQARDRLERLYDRVECGGK